MKAPFNPRSLWRPKLKEVSDQCASCPFRDNNDDAFGRILRWLFGAKKKITPRVVRQARMNVKSEVMMMGDFVCHYTAFNKDGTHKPQTEFRQCKGASEFYRGIGAQ